MKFAIFLAATASALSVDLEEDFDMTNPWFEGTMFGQVEA